MQISVMKVSRGCCSSAAKELGKRSGAENIGDGGSEKLLFVFGDQWFVKEIGNSKTVKTVSVVSKRSGEDIGDNGSEKLLFVFGKGTWHVMELLFGFGNQWFVEVVGCKDR